MAGQSGRPGGRVYIVGGKDFRKEELKMLEDENCFGCEHLRSEWFGDGSTLYKCARTPGLVVGSSDALDGDSGLKRCKYFKSWRDTNGGK